MNDIILVTIRVKLKSGDLKMTKIKPNASSPRLSILLLSILFAGLYLFTSAQVGGAAPLDAVTGYSLPVSAMTNRILFTCQCYDQNFRF